MSLLDKNEYSHGTAAEMAFIDRLRAAEDCVAKLRGYLIGSAKRSNWDAIDKMIALPYAQQQLKDAEVSA